MTTLDAPTLPNAERAADVVRQDLDEWHAGRAVAPAHWLRGGAGVGKSWVVSKVVEHARRFGLPVVDVRPPELGLDGVIQLAAQGAGSLREASVNGVLNPVFDATQSEQAKIAALMQGMDKAPTQGLLALDLPSSWGDDTRRPDLARTQGRALDGAREVLRYARERDWAVILTTDPRPQAAGHLLSAEPTDIAARSDGLAFLRDESRWSDALAHHAKRLADDLGGDANTNTPLELRVAVGLLALPQGAMLHVREACRGGLRNLRGLLNRILRASPRLSAVFATLSLARFPVSDAVLAGLEARLDDDDQRAMLRHSLLLERSAGWIVHESLRSPPAETDPEYAPSHAALIALESTEAVQTRSEAVNLLERLHHAASAGREDLIPESRDAQLPDASVLLKLGRAASLAQRYADSAGFYERALTLQPDSTYAKEYLAFNLDRAGQGRQRALDLFRQAVSDEPENPWWSRRLAVAYLRRGRPKECAETFRRAMRNFERSARPASPRSLAENFHVDLVRELLARAELGLAREVLSTIDPEIRRVFDDVRELWNRLQHREEVEETGACVFPEDVRFDERWIGPHYLSEADRDAGDTALEWRPGRIVDIRPGALEIELGIPPKQDSAAQYVRTTVTEQAFLEAANRRNLRDVRAGQFLDLMSSDQDATIVLRSPLPSRRQDPWHILRGWKPDVAG